VAMLAKQAFSRYHFVISMHYHCAILKEKIHVKGKKMKLSTVLQKVVKKEGKHSLTSKTIAKLKNSKEFSYLVDIAR
jgi:hypothetical protein